MLVRISLYELHEWFVYYGLEPFGEERADLRAGIIASTIANKPAFSRGGRTKPSDFMVDFCKQAPPVPRQQTAEEQYVFMRALFSRRQKNNG